MAEETFAELPASGGARARDEYELRFQKAQPSDLREVVQLFEGAIENMNRNHILQWDEIYPNEEVLREDIEKEQMYLGRIDNKIASVYVLSGEYDDEYNHADWRYPEASFVILHRLCVHPAFQNRGVARRTMERIEESVRKSGVETIRLDAFSENPYALRLYKGLGYHKTGTANWRKGLFYLYEKNLTV